MSSINEGFNEHEAGFTYGYQTQRLTTVRQGPG